MNGYATYGDGVTAFDALDDALVPAAFVAVTVKVYVVPLVRPGTVAVVTVPELLPGQPPGLEVTV